MGEEDFSHTPPLQVLTKTKSNSHYYDYILVTVYDYTSSLVQFLPFIEFITNNPRFLGLFMSL
jgi:hypothetical protein